MFKFLFFATSLLTLCCHTYGQESIDLSHLSQEELQVLHSQGAITGDLQSQLPQTSGGIGGLINSLVPSASGSQSSGSQSSGSLTSGSAGTTFYDRLMTVVQPIRNFNLRETFTGFFRRITTFLFPVQTVQATARDGTAILKPEIELIIDNLVDRILKYGESYFSGDQ